MITSTRYHDISCGHRVVGHEGKCKNLHGHNYRIHFTCTSEELDDVGRVIDFSVMKEKLCIWLEKEWDHRFLIWYMDPNRDALTKIDKTAVWTEFNPTAENIAKFLVEKVGPEQLKGTGVVLIGVTVEETMKCCASYELDNYLGSKEENV